MPVEHLDVDLNLLRVLAALLATRNVTHTARRLGVTQPGVSRSLARLRELFGDPLLVRAGRSLQPTARALELEPRLRALVQAAADVLEEAAPRAGRRLVVGAADYGEVVALPLVLRVLSRLAPGAAVESRFVGGQIELLLQRGEIDLFLGAGAPPIDGVIQRKLLRDENVLVLRRRHPAADRPASVELVEVAPRGPGTGLASLPLGRSWSPRIAVSTPHFTSAIELVRTSDLGAIVPRRLVDALGHRDLVSLAPPAPLPEFWLSVYSARARQRDRWLATLREELAAAAASRPAS